MSDRHEPQEGLETQSARSMGSNVVTLGDLVIDLPCREIRAAGAVVPFTRLEFDILAYMAAHPGWVISPDQLMEGVWGYSSLGDSRTVSVHMGNMRRKLEHAGASGCLHTVRGAGYKLQAPDATTAHNAARGLSPFVGRAKQLSLLDRLHEHVLTGLGGRAVIVWGEAGIGKTRLMEEVGARAAGRGALVLWGRSLEDEGAPAYWPWMQVLRALHRSVDIDVIQRAVGMHGSELAILSPELGGADSDQQPSSTHSGAEARFRMFDAVAMMLQDLAKEHPLVLMLDDLHDADRASLALLEHIARELPSTRILIVGGARDVEIGPDHPLSGLLATLTREAIGEHVSLPAMSQSEVSRLVEMVAATPPDPDLVDAIWRETDGNPFFVTQITRLLVAEGSMAGQTGLNLDILSRVPEGVRATVHRRLAGLSDDCRRVLRTGAVVGREFDLRLVACVSGVGSSRAAVALDEAASARLVGIVSNDYRFRFRHNLTRQATYETLGESERLHLHGEVGDYLEALHADRLENHHEELAYHYQQAVPSGWIDKAVRYTMLAGTAAAARYAWEDARRHFERTLALASQLEGPGTRREVMASTREALGDSLVVTDGYDEARSEYVRALGALPVEARISRSRLHRKIARTFKEERRLSEASESFKQAACELGDFVVEGSGEAWREWLDGELELAWVLYYSGDLQGIERLLAEAEPALEHHGSLVQRLGFLRCRVLHCLRRDGNWASEEGLTYGRAQLDWLSRQEPPPR